MFIILVEAMLNNKEVINVSKAIFKAIDNIKNVTNHNVTTLVNSGEIKIDKNQLPKLIAILNASIDQGLHQNTKNLEKEIQLSITKALSESKKK